MHLKTIYILGAGTIGKALAVFLKLKNRNVILVRTSTHEIFTSSEKITVQLHDNTALNATVEITSLEALANLDGLIVLTHKSFANKNIAPRLKEKSGQSPVVVMQNGLHVEEPFIEAGFTTLYRCVLFATSQQLPDKTIRYKPVSPSPIGLIKGTEFPTDDLIRALDNEHLRFAVHDAIQAVIWRKTIANCVFNSICPLLDIDNGLFHRNETARAIALRVIRECVAVAAQTGVVLDTQEVLNTVLLISQSSEGQLISTLQDIKNGRETEIESLNFAIVRTAMSANHPGSVAETRLLGELVRLKSELTRSPV
jgi:2-dehydropantoate 2-reductase